MAKKTNKDQVVNQVAIQFSELTNLSNHVSVLIEASMNAHYSDVRKMGSLIANDLAKLGFESDSKKITSALKKKGVPLQASGQLEFLPSDVKSKLPLIEEISWPTSPLFINEEASITFQRLITDTQNSHLLSGLGLSSSLCLLLVGPPGTGKTLLAGHIASQLRKPLYVVRLDSVISSLLGETAKNIRSVFDYIPKKNAVLFLDEIDAIAKMRDDKHELGEIKRIVNTLIQGLDSVDDQTVVIGATNHPHILDKAIWRRFPYKIELNNPDTDVRESMWKYFLFNDDDKEDVSKSLSIITEDFSGAEIQELALQIRRQAILGKVPLTTDRIGTAVLKYLRSQQLHGSSFSNTNEDIKKYFASYLCNLKGLTQTDAAKLLGVTRQTIYSYLKEADNG